MSTDDISGRVAWPSMSTSSPKAAFVKLYAVALMLSPCFSRRAAAYPARTGGTTRCPLIISSFAAPAELMLALLAKCLELFLLHGANCVDGVLACEDEGT